MTKLTNNEIKLIDEYIIRHQFTEIDQPHFLYALANILPTWRSEALVGTDLIYSNNFSPAYLDYLNTFNDTKN